MINIQRELWRMGKTPRCIVSSIGSYASRERSSAEIDHYGGYLVAESVPNLYYISLITAAPDLYRVCKKIFERLTNMADKLGDGEFSPLDIAEELRKIDLAEMQDAIDKAEGWLLS